MALLDFRTCFKGVACRDSSCGSQFVCSGFGAIYIIALVGIITNGLTMLYLRIMVILFDRLKSQMACLKIKRLFYVSNKNNYKVLQ